MSQRIANLFLLWVLQSGILLSLALYKPEMHIEHEEVRQEVSILRAIVDLTMSDKVLAWLSVWREVHIVCIWSGQYHRHPKTLSSLLSH